MNPRTNQYQQYHIGTYDNEKGFTRRIDDYRLRKFIIFPDKIQMFQSLRVDKDGTLFIQIYSKIGEKVYFSEIPFEGNDFVLQKLISEDLVDTTNNIRYSLVKIQSDETGINLNRANIVALSPSYRRRLATKINSPYEITTTHSRYLKKDNNYIEEPNNSIDVDPDCMQDLWSEEIWQSIISPRLVEARLNRVFEEVRRIEFHEGESKWQNIRYSFLYNDLVLIETQDLTEINKITNLITHKAGLPLVKLHSDTKQRCERLLALTEEIMLHFFDIGVEEFSNILSERFDRHFALPRNLSNIREKQEEIDTILKAVRIGVLLHDLGKVSMPDLIDEDKELSEQDMKTLRKHPVIGEIIFRSVIDNIAQIVDMSPAFEIISQHHEKYDGSGYPKHLKGKEISPYARLFAIISALDTMAIETEERQPIPYYRARLEIILTSNIHNNLDKYPLARDWMNYAKEKIGDRDFRKIITNPKYSSQCFDSDLAYHTLQYFDKEYNYDKYHFSFENSIEDKSEYFKMVEIKLGLVTN